MKLSTGGPCAAATASARGLCSTASRPHSPLDALAPAWRRVASIDPSEHAASFTRWLKLSGFLVRNIKPYELANIKRKVQEMMVDAIRDDRSPTKLTA